MDTEKHLFHLDSVWTGNSDGEGTLIAERGATLDYGVPPELGGTPGRSNPEEMLLGAIASCYSITLAFLAERARLPVERIAVAAEGEVIRQPDRTLKYTVIRLHPRITLVGSTEGQRKVAQEFAHKAEKYCVISNALRGNVEISVTPEILGE